MNPCFVEYPSRDVLRCAIGIGDEEFAERHSIGLPLCEDFVGGLKVNCSLAIAGIAL